MTSRVTVSNHETSRTSFIDTNNLSNLSITDHSAHPTNTINTDCGSPTPGTSMSGHHEILPQQPRRLTQRELMAENIPSNHKDTPDPDFLEFKESIDNVRLFEESHFWQDPSLLCYNAASDLYPGTIDSDLWPSEQHLMSHAKKLHLTSKLERLTLSKVHSVDIPPTERDISVARNTQLPHPPPSIAQRPITSYMTNNPVDNNTNNLRGHIIEPLTVKFSIDPNTNTHARSASYPQQPARDTEPMYVETPENNAILGPANGNPRPHDYNPLLNATFGETPPTPPGQNNVRQVYFAEILPDALDLWKNFRNASQLVGFVLVTYAISPVLDYKLDYKLTDSEFSSYRKD